MSTQNREKLTSSHLVRKMSTLDQLPPCPCGHTINFEKIRVFLHQKVRTSASEEPLPLVRKMSERDNPASPPWLRSLLWTFSYHMTLRRRLLKLSRVQSYGKEEGLWSNSGGATRPLMRDGGVEELHGDSTVGPCPKVWTKGQKWKK